MDLVTWIIGIPMCALFAIYIVVLEKWNKKLLKELRERSNEYNEAQFLLSHVGFLPPVRYYFYVDESGLAFVHGVYLNEVDVIIKRFTSDNAAYNKLCAEELVEKLNERI